MIRSDERWDGKWDGKWDGRWDGHLTNSYISLTNINPTCNP